MTPRLLSLVTLAAALGCGLVAGVFFAFSTFVMPALARLPAGQGLAAMQAINVAAINRWLLGLLFGTAAACAVLAVASLGRGDLAAWARLAGASLYLVGVVVVTGAFNVPRNEALGRVDPGAAEAAATWARYLVEWTAWNHVRMAAAVLAAVALLAAAVAAGGAAPRGAP